MIGPLLWSFITLLADILKYSFTRLSYLNMEEREDTSMELFSRWRGGQEPFVE
jgi:hypothetical protein